MSDVPDPFAGLDAAIDDLLQEHHVEDGAQISVCVGGRHCPGKSDGGSCVFCYRFLADRALSGAEIVADMRRANG